MNYNVMSMKKPSYRSVTLFESALAAATARNLLPNATVTQDIIDKYGPFVRFHFENRSTEVIRICIGGVSDGTSAILYSEREWFIQPNYAMDIIPEDDKILFTSICIVNTDAVNATSDNELIWSINNY